MLICVCEHAYIYTFNSNAKREPWGLLHIMAYTGRLRPKGVPFSGFRYINGYGFQKFRYCIILIYRAQHEIKMTRKRPVLSLCQVF